MGEKEKTNKRTIRPGLIQAQEEKLCNIAFPICICRLTLAWISSEISTKLLGMPTHLDCSSLTDSWTLSHANWSLCCPVSTGHSRHPSLILLLWVPLSNSTCVPLPTSGHVEIAGSRLCLVSRQNKGIVCLADELHSVTEFCIMSVKVIKTINFMAYLSLLDSGNFSLTSSSSSCRVISTDMPDTFSPPLPIVNRFRQVLRATPRILTELLYVGSSWSPCFCSAM